MLGYYDICKWRHKSVKKWQCLRCVKQLGSEQPTGRIQLTSTQATTLCLTLQFKRRGTKCSMKVTNTALETELVVLKCCPCGDRPVLCHSVVQQLAAGNTNRGEWRHIPFLCGFPNFTTSPWGSYLFVEEVTDRLWSVHRTTWSKKFRNVSITNAAYAMISWDFTWFY